MAENKSKIAQASLDTKKGDIPMRDKKGFAMFKDNRVSFLLEKPNPTKPCKATSIVDSVNNSKQLLDDLLNTTPKKDEKAEDKLPSSSALEELAKEVEEECINEISQGSDTAKVFISEAKSQGTIKTISVYFKSGEVKTFDFNRKASPIKCLNSVIDMYTQCEVFISSKYKSKVEELKDKHGISITAISSKDMNKYLV